MTSFTSKRILNIEFDDKEKGHPYEMKYFCLGYLLCIYYNFNLIAFILVYCNIKLHIIH
jgi:hypothetical protein